MSVPSLDPRRWWLATALAFSAAMAGCGPGGPKIVKVTGRVTRGGQPIKDLTLNFEPASGRPSWGLTDADGRFTLHYSREQDGACVGEHKVWVVFDPKPADPNAEMARLEGRVQLPQDVQAIVEKYGRGKSPLVFNIQKAEDLDIKLD